MEFSAEEDLVSAWICMGLQFVLGECHIGPYEPPGSVWFCIEFPTEENLVSEWICMDFENSGLYGAV